MNNLQRQDQTFTAFKDRKRFLNLDGLRFFAIFMVLWHHAPGLDFEMQLFSRGFLGVDFFFVLSGFLITTLLLREWERYGSFSLKNFYIRRALRIIPVYYFVVSFVCIYFVLIQGREEFSELVPYYYLFLSNFLIGDIPTLDPTWSLSVEEQFYIVWPLLLLLTPQRWIMTVCVVLIAVNVAIITGVFGLNPAYWGPLKIALPNSTYAPLIIGALLACILNRSHGYTLLARYLSGRWTVVLLVAVLLVCFEFFPEDLRGVPNLCIHLLMAVIIAGLVIREDGIGSGLLQNVVVARIGVVSYGIYLYHLLALDVVNRGMSAFGMSSDLAILLLYSVLSYVVAEISFRTLEAYFQKFRPQRS